MPEQMVSHWSGAGVPNGYSSSFWGSFSMPLVMIFMFVLFYFIPRIDPMKENIEKFINYYIGFCAVLFLFIFYIQFLMLTWNIGYRFSIVLMMVPAFFILFFYIGILLSKAEQNMSIGIRTAWTIKDKEVWDKTHKRTAVLIKIASFICLFGLVFKKFAIWFVLAPIVAVFLYSTIYSYVIYKQKENKSKIMADNRKNNLAKKH